VKQLEKYQLMQIVIDEKWGEEQLPLFVLTGLRTVCQ